MKSRVFLRFSSVVLCLMALANLFSCKTARSVFDSESYIFENQTDYKNYFVRIDSVGESDVNGRIYLIDNDLTLQAEPFSKFSACRGFKVKIKTRYIKKQ